MPCLGRGAQFLRVRISLQDVEPSPMTLKCWPELWRIPQLSKDGRQRFINRLKQPPLTQRFTLPLSVFPYSTRALAQPRGRSPLGRCHAAQCIAAQRPQCTGRRTNRNRRTGILRESHATAAPRADCPGELSQGRTEWALGGFGEFGSSWKTACKPQARLGQAPIPRVWFQRNCSPHGGSAALPGHLSEEAHSPPPDRKGPQAEPAGSLICPDVSSGLSRCRSPVWSHRQLFAARSFHLFSSRAVGAVRFGTHTNARSTIFFRPRHRSGTVLLPNEERRGQRRSRDWFAGIICRLGGRLRHSFLS